MWPWKSSECQHQFDLDDLELTGIKAPREPAKSDYQGWVEYYKEYYNHPFITHRVRWPCAICGKEFFAHCGLDIAPRHGPILKRAKA